MCIKCAAIQYEDEVYEGDTHASIGLQMVAKGICKRYPSGEAQGFITECGRYVLRGPALAIAINAGQVERGRTINSRNLFSEDLAL